MAQFFYDEQIRRFLLQFARIFSNFDVEFGTNEAGQGPDSSQDTLVRVPVRYGDASRQAQTILNNNSASNMPATPMMTFYVTDLKYDRPRIQEPNFINNIAVRQRTYDPVTDSYETTQGNAFTIERIMPVPYEMTINLDIWTSNTNQKMQLLEQILTLFNPSLEIQSTDNYIDWTSLTVLYLDDVKWSSRVIPIGTDNPIDIATLTFKLPMWITPPAKVKKLGVIERIITSVYDAQGDLVNAITNSDLLLGTRQKFTPYGYQVLALAQPNTTTLLKLQALRQQQPVDQPNASLEQADSPQSNLLWSSIIGMYGVLRPGISYITLEQPDGTDVMGTIAIDPTDDRFLLFTLNEGTVPANTLGVVNAVIDPLISGPNNGLPAPVLNQRYLLTNAIGSHTNPTGTGPEAWAGVSGEPLVARANDIIRWNGNYWEVFFDSTSSPDNIQYVTNLTTELQYRWTGSMWVKSYQGLYPGGQWTIVL
jgi:hypothetical protein